MTKLSKGEETRRRMLETAATLMQAQGYHATGLKQILEESGTPRGSLYFHFPEGKEQLACEAASTAGLEWQNQLSDVVAQATSAEEGFAAVIDLLGERLETSGWRLGNPIATLALEMSPYSDVIQQTCSDGYRAWQTIIEDMMDRFDVGPRSLRPSLAIFLLSSVEGALVLARTHRSLEPLEVVKQTLVAMAGMLDAT